MADERVKDLTTTATQHASDDYFDLDGSTNGSRKILASKYAHVELNSTPAGGYILDGTDDRIEVSDDDNLDLGTGDFTLEAYFKTGSDITTDQIIMAKRSGGLGNGFEISVSSSVLRFMKLSSVTLGIISYSVSANTLYHFLITKSDSTYSMYINGEQVSYTGSITLTDTLSNSDNFFIGANLTAFCFKEQIYFVRVYNRALSASEIVKLWDNGKPELSQLPYEDRNASTTDVVVNGDFATDSDWTKGGTNVTISAGKAVWTNAPQWAVIYQTENPIILGKRYRYTFDIEDLVEGAVLIAGAKILSTSGTISAGVEAYFTTVGTHYVELITNQNIVIYGSGANNTFKIDNVTATQLGCVVEYLPNNAGKFGWLETQNRLHGSTLGSPIATSAGLFENYKDIKLNVTGNSILTNVVPKEYRLKGILFNNTTANTVVINVGTSSGGTDVVNAQSVPAGLTFVSLAKIFSLTADQTLYVSSADWNSASVNVELSMSKY